MRFLGERNLDRLTMLLLSAMAIVPFLHPHHYNPIPSFFAEWWAALFGLGACAAAFLRPGAWQRFPLPAILLAPLLMLGEIVVQHFSGRIEFVEQGLIYASYLLWAILLACLGQDLVRRRGLAFLADAFASAVLAGALLEVITVVLELQDVGAASGLVFPRHRVPWGNLGQLNHLNDYLWLGIVSLCYLWARSHLRIRFLVAALFVLLASSALTGSRSSLLYALALASLGYLTRNRSLHTGQMSRLSTLAAALPLGALLFVVATFYLGPLLYSHAGGGSLERLYADVGSPSIRLKLWHGAWQSFSSAPLLGQGVGSAPWQYFTIGERFPFGGQPLVAEHAHNLFVQLLLEFGAVLTLVVAGLGAFWLWRYCRRPWSIERWWLAGMLLVTGLHAMLEYPLWYTFFLGPVALLLGAGDEGRQQLRNGRRGLAAFAIILALSGVILGTLRNDFIRMERILNWSALGDGGEMEWPKAVNTLLDLYRASLLSPQANLVFALMMQPTKEHVADRVYICNRARRFAPVTQVVFKCPVLEAMAGNAVEAQRQLSAALAAYPDHAALAAQAYAGMLGTTPEVQPLLDMARQTASRYKVRGPAP